MTKLIFVRHGETTHNVRAVISSAAPGPGINANGRRQAHRLAKKFSASSIDRIYTSPLRRARQTAEILVRRRGIVPILSPVLRECGVGELEGRSDTAAFSRYHDAWDQWLCGQALDFPLGPGGETGYAVLARMRAMINGACAADPNGTVLLVSHAGILHFTLSLLLTNLTSIRAQLLPIPNAGVVVAVHDKHGLRCEDWCGTPVLGGA